MYKFLLVVFIALSSALLIALLIPTTPSAHAFSNISNNESANTSANASVNTSSTLTSAPLSVDANTHYTSDTITLHVDSAYLEGTEIVIRGPGGTYKIRDVNSIQTITLLVPGEYHITLQAQETSDAIDEKIVQIISSPIVIDHNTYALGQSVHATLDAQATLQEIRNLQTGETYAALESDQGVEKTVQFTPPNVGVYAINVLDGRTRNIYTQTIDVISTTTPNTTAPQPPPTEQTEEQTPSAEQTTEQSTPQNLTIQTPPPEEQDTLLKQTFSTRASAATIDDIQRHHTEHGDRYDIHAHDNRTGRSNRITLRGATLSNNSNITFLDAQNTATDIVHVEQTQIESATIELAKTIQEPIAAIARCEQFNEQQQCINWVRTDIPFTDLGDRIAFNVTHFSGYAGILNNTYYYVENNTPLNITGTTEKTHAQISFYAVNNSQWLVMAFTNYRSNLTQIAKIYFYQNNTEITRVWQNLSNASVEVDPFVYAYVFTGANQTVSFKINATGNNAAQRTDLISSRILAIRLDGMANADYDTIYDTVNYTGIDATYGNQVNDTINLSIQPPSAGKYLLIGAASYRGTSTTSNMTIRLNLNGSLIVNNITEVDSVTTEWHNAFMMRVLDLQATPYNLTMQAMGRTGTTAMWQDRSLTAVRLSGVFSFRSANTTSISTTNSTTPVYINNLAGNIYPTHNYTLLSSALVNINYISRQISPNTYLQGSAIDSISIQPKSAADYLSSGTIDLLNGSSSFVANNSLLVSNAASNSTMKNAELLLLELGSYNNPILLNNLAVGPAYNLFNNSLVRVNVSISNDTALNSALLEVDPPISPKYNVTLSRNGTTNEWYNNSVVLNETGLWNFTAYVNDSVGFEANTNLSNVLIQAPTQVNLSINQTAYLNGTNISVFGTYYWWNGSVIIGKNVTINFLNTSGNIVQTRNVTTNGSGVFNDTYSISATPNIGTWLVNVVGRYNNTINASNSNTLFVDSIPVMNSSRIMYTYYGYTVYGYCNASANTNNTRYAYTWYRNNTAVYNNTAYIMGISAGSYFTCGIRTNDSQVLCWGANPQGQLGDGSYTDHFYPLPINDTSDYLMVSTGDQHTCGIRANDSRVLCWGDDTNGQLGNNVTGGFYPTPVLTNDTSAYTYITTGTQRTCGIRANDSRVLCWGDNVYGTLGDNSTISKNVPTLTNDTSAYTYVGIGGYFACGIRANDSRILCWGLNTVYSLGDGTNIDKTIPTLVNDTSAYRMLSVGSEHSCAIRANDSKVLCWGNDFWGELGDNRTNTNRSSPAPINDTAAYAFIAAGVQDTCGIRANDSRVLCWGSANSGQIGDNSTVTNRSVPTLTNDTSAYLTISVDQGMVFGIRANDSALMCWGGNGNGQCGDNTTIMHTLPTPSPYTTNYIVGFASGTEQQVGAIPPGVLGSDDNITLQCCPHDGYFAGSCTNISFVPQRGVNISAISSISAINPQINANVSVLVNFTVRDYRGADNINDSTALVKFNASLITRVGSCSATTLNVTYKRYNCSAQMTFYDLPGTWSVNVSIKNNQSYNTSNTTTTFTYNSLFALDISNAAFNFGSFAPGSANQYGLGNPLNVSNLGNVNITGLNITAYNLVNLTKNGIISAGNFTINTTNATGMRLANNTLLLIPNSSIMVRNDTWYMNRSLFFYISTPTGQPAGVYSSQQSWVVSG